MVFTRGWIVDAVKTLNLSVIEVSESETRKLIGEIQKQFCGRQFSGPIWHGLLAHFGERWEEGWVKAGEYVGDRSCVLICDSEPCAFRIKNGVELNGLLGECPLFEFYVTDDAFNFLICQNDHGYLIGAGDAASWIQWEWRKTFFPLWEWDRYE